MTTSTDRQTFRETVALVADKARAALPTQVNGRIESAVKLVLMHDVEPQDDGTILVGSSTDALKQYRLEGQSCECQDFTRGGAPEGWCQHRIAAGIAKRVQQLLPVVPEVVEETAVETEPTLPASPAVPRALPEAPASCNVSVMISGHKVQVTLRDTDEHRMLARLAVVLQQFPVQAPTSPQRPPRGRCRRASITAP